ncbi:hypothetical protein OG323_14410 [Streptomyces cyaneofuscatus]|uniref:hypothetical protein n=1 Tax=Streptomyces cyaneofuscatus TaxID=66883 RepID=UPI0038657BF7|nr:hypothetical protein OG323_14410 [Streptomyces cyaneofuscatus]
MVISAQERLADVVAAAVEVAAETAEAGAYTAEVGRTLTSVVGKVGARIALDAEVRGFTGGWQEAVALMAPKAPADAQVFRMPGRAPEGANRPDPTGRSGRSDRAGRTDGPGYAGRTDGPGRAGRTDGPEHARRTDGPNRLRPMDARRPGRTESP